MHIHERRKHFRVDSKALVDYQVLDNQDVENEFQYLIYCENAAAAFEQEVLLSAIQDLDHDAIRYDSYNHYRENLRDSLTQTDMQDVNISVGGMAFSSSSLQKIGTKIGIHLMLSPESKMLNVTAKIVACQPRQKQQDYLLRVQFEEMLAEDKTYLAKEMDRLLQDYLKDHASVTTIPIAPTASAQQ